MTEAGGIPGLGDLSASQRELCDTLVSIPMDGAVDSLNLAVAGGLMLYEVFRQR